MFANLAVAAGLWLVARPTLLHLVVAVVLLSPILAISFLVGH